MSSLLLQIKGDNLQSRWRQEVWESFGPFERQNYVYNLNFDEVPGRVG
jgi:hypothetical protein